MWTGTGIEYFCAFLLATLPIAAVGGLIRFSFLFCCQNSPQNRNSHDCQKRFLECYFKAVNMDYMNSRSVCIRQTTAGYMIASQFYFMVMICVCASKAFGCRCSCTDNSDCCQGAVQVMIASYLPLYIMLVLLPFIKCFNLCGQNVGQPQAPAADQPTPDQANPANTPLQTQCDLTQPVPPPDQAQVCFTTQPPDQAQICIPVAALHEPHPSPQQHQPRAEGLGCA